VDAARPSCEDLEYLFHPKHSRAPTPSAGGTQKNRLEPNALGRCRNSKPWTLYKSLHSHSRVLRPPYRNNLRWLTDTAAHPYSMWLSLSSASARSRSRFAQYSSVYSLPIPM